jgi:hypothetical protein
MAEIIVETPKLTEDDCLSIPQASYGQLADWLKSLSPPRLRADEEIAFALLVVDKPTGGTEPRFLLLTHPERSPVHTNWHVKDQADKYFPRGDPGDADPEKRPRQVNPQPPTGKTPGDVLVITYPGEEYKGFCTTIGGRPYWF